MTNNDGVGNYFVPHPERMKVDFLPIEDWTDYIWIAIVTLATFQLTSLIPADFRSLGLLVGVLFALFTLWPIVPTRDERLYYLLLVAPFKEAQMIFKRGKIWQAGEKPVFPYVVRAIGDMGLIYDLEKQTYSMVFKVSGSIAATLGLMGQMGQNGTFAKILRQASSATGLRGLRITLGYDIRPGDPFAVRHMLAKIGNMNALLPQALVEGKDPSEYTRQDRRDIKRRQIANEMEELAFEATRPDSMVFVVTVKDNRAFRKILRRGVGYQSEVRNESLYRIRETLTTMFRTVTQEARLINGDEAEEYLRVARDIAEIYEYYAQLETHKAAVYDAPTEEEAAAEQAKLSSIVKPDPVREIRAYPDSLLMDGTFATKIKLTEFPLDQPPVDYIRDYSPVFNLPSDFYSINITGKTSKGSVGFFLNDIGTTITDTGRNILGRDKKGIVADEEEAKRYEEQKRLRASYVIKFKPSATLLSYDREKLEDETIRTMDRLTENTLGPQREVGRHRQFRSVLSSLVHIPE